MALKADTLSIDYPDDFELYLEKGAEILERLRKTPNGKTSRSELIRSVGDYLYYVMRCHPFPRLNLSLFMSHVNYLLVRGGLRGISPDNLDYRIFSSTRDEFREDFRRRVVRQNLRP